QTGRQADVARGRAGRQRAAEIDPARGGRPDPGGKGFRLACDAGFEAYWRRRLRRPPADGLLRPPPARRRAAGPQCQPPQTGDGIASTDYANPRNTWTFPRATNPNNLVLRWGLHPL